MGQPYSYYYSVVTIIQLEREMRIVPVGELFSDG